MRSDARKRMQEQDPHMWPDSSDVVGRLREAEAKLSQVRSVVASMQCSPIENVRNWAVLVDLALEGK